MVRSNSPAPAGGSAAFHASPSRSGEISRPRGVGLTALAFSVLVGIDLVRDLLHLVRFSGTLAPFPILEQLFLCGARGLAWPLLWQYWKGRDWARVFVLLWSLLVAVRALVFLADHNLDPAALMSRPLSFFHALLAVWVLYWLNTPPLRAWFKNISSTAADLIRTRLVGKLCTALEFHSPAVEALCRLSFEHDAELTLLCPWRIVLDDNLAFAHAPAAHAPAAGSAAIPAHAPAAGSAAIPDSAPDPSSDPDAARRLLQNLRVTAVHLAPHTSDLFLTFEMGIQLQTWSYAPAAGREALPQAPSSAALLWSFSDPGLTVTANADGLSSQLVAAPAEPPPGH